MGYRRLWRRTRGVGRRRRRRDGGKGGDGGDVSITLQDTRIVDRGVINHVMNIRAGTGGSLGDPEIAEIARQNAGNGGDVKVTVNPNLELTFNADLNIASGTDGQGTNSTGNAADWALATSCSRETYSDKLLGEGRRAFAGNADPLTRKLNEA